MKYFIIHILYFNPAIFYLKRILLIKQIFFPPLYHLHNFSENIRLRYSVSTSVNETAVFTASKLFESANWMERETYDFFGINFIGHPNLKRILNVDEMDYFPLRKQYPLEDQTRIDKDDEMFGRG